MVRILLFTTLSWLLIAGCREAETPARSGINPYLGSKPYTRWWWFASIIKEQDIADQLNWLKANNFGGVEIAFIYPVNRDPNADRLEWLGEDLRDRLVFCKQYCDSIGLGCDYTFGTLWPFGGTFVDDRDRTQVFGDSAFKQPLRLSWTHPDTGNVLNHLDSNAFRRYAGEMKKMIQPALEGKPAALFCDSWEVETRKIWTHGFGKTFKDRFGYSLQPYMDSIYAPSNSQARYDYMRLVSDHVISHFYEPFTSTCHEMGTLSRVQCAGSPTDLIDAYAAVDIPESEAMLYNPEFSVIPASAAVLSNKPVVTAESFTCLYGWPREHIEEEYIMDLKLVADALFANGINQIIWHGTPYNPSGIDSIRFYATVHVGRTGSLSEHLAGFNIYLDQVSGYLQSGTTYTDVAVYLPIEDSWIAGEYPDSLQMPWSWGQYELRYLDFNPEIAGRHPLWINSSFLKKATVSNGRLHLDKASFNLLYVGVQHLDGSALDRILYLARKGLPVCLKSTPAQPGMSKTGKYKEMLDQLTALPNVSANLAELRIQKPLISGDPLPEYWCRKVDDKAYIFMAHPAAGNLTYPLAYRQSEKAKSTTLVLTFNWKDHTFEREIVFEKQQSVLLEISKSGIRQIDIMYFPE